MAEWAADHLERDDFSSNRHPALSFCLSMIFSENRYPPSDQVRGHAFPDHALVLLSQKFRRRFLCIGAAQHGHLGNVLARATIRRCRIVAIEFGTCRWVRSGGASGSVTVGNGRCLERPGGTRA